MKDQVSVDMGAGESETARIVCMPELEYQRLRRLDENRKQLIENYKKCLNGKFGNDYAKKIALLESLDKTN